MPSEPTPRIPEAAKEKLAKSFWETRTFGETLPPWEQLGEDERQAHLQNAETFIANDLAPLLCAGLEEDLKEAECRPLPEELELVIGRAEKAEQQLAEVRAEVERLRGEADAVGNTAALTPLIAIAAILGSSSSLSGEYRDGELLRHPNGSEWQVRERLGGDQDDYRCRRVVGTEQANITGEERVFHREYMDRTFTRDLGPLSCGACGGTDPDCTVCHGLATQHLPGKSLPREPGDREAPGPLDLDALCGDGVQSSGLLGEAATDLSDYAAEREDPDDERRLLDMSKRLRALRAALNQPPADPDEVARCGTCGGHQCAVGDDGSSHGVLLNKPCPDCQSTPELVGEGRFIVFCKNVAGDGDVWFTDTAEDVVCVHGRDCCTPRVYRAIPVSTNTPAAEPDDRLYVLLALFDRRDGSPLGDLVRAAREGFERSHPDMGEEDNRLAWEEFDHLWESYDQDERLALTKPPFTQPVSESPGDSGERLKLKVIVSGAPFEVKINRDQPISALVTAGLLGAGIKIRDDLDTTWQVRTEQGVLLDNLSAVQDGAVLFLDPEAGGGASIQSVPGNSGAVDPYICQRCKRVYVYLDLMGDPACECGSTSFSPVLLSAQALSRLSLPSGNSGGVEEAVGLLQREEQDAKMWVERHWQVEQVVGATMGGEWPWLDRVKVFSEAGGARLAQEQRAETMRAAAALIAKSPAAARRNGRPCTCKQFEMVDDEEIVEQSPAEPQGDVVEKVARFLFDGSKVDPVHWDRITPRQKDWLRKEARELLTIVTPLIHLEIKERLEEICFERAGKHKAESIRKARLGAGSEASAARAEGKAIAYRLLAEEIAEGALAALAPVSSEDACDCHAAQHPAWTGCPVHGRKGPPAPVSSEPEVGK